MAVERLCRVSQHGARWSRRAHAVRVAVVACLVLPASAFAVLEDERALPAMPAARSGAFVGVVGDTLLVAGGTLVAEGDDKPAGGLTDSVIALPAGEDAWREIGKLSSSRAGGASVSHEAKLICIGGSDGDQCFADVVAISVVDGALVSESWPPLPSPRSLCRAAILGKTLYVIGGQEQPDGPVSDACWSLDFENIDAGWASVAPLPGAGRVRPVVAAQAGGLLVAGGEAVVEEGGSRGPAFADGFKFTPESGWKAITPAPVAFADLPALVTGQTQVLILGVPGVAADEPEAGDGRTNAILSYNMITDAWAELPQRIEPAHGGWVGFLGNDAVMLGGAAEAGNASSEVRAYGNVSSRRAFAVVDFIVLAVYLGLLVWMGFYFAKREKSTEDFFLGGGRVPWWAAGLSIFGTQLSALTFMAVPAKAFATDWTYFIVSVAIVLISPAVVFFYLPFFRRLRVTTAYEYLEHRFNLPTRLFASFSFIVFQLGRMAIVVYLPALALAAVTGLDVFVCILIMGVLCTVYTVAGGIEAVIWTDVLQVFVLLGGALLSLVIIITRVDGGVGEIFAISRSFDKFHMINWSWDYTAAALWVVLIGNLLSNLVPYTSDQTVVQRYLTTASEKKAAQAIWTNAALTLPAGVIFFGVGTALFAFYRLHPGQLDPTVATDGVFPWFIAQELPSGVSGLVIAGLFAAAMSSLDSSMNSVSAAIVTDFYRRFRSERSDEAYLRLARLLTVLLGAIGTGAALFMATYQIQSLWDLFLKILGLLGGGMAGLFALGIFTRRANGKGALIGAAASVVVLYVVQRHTDVHFFLYGGVGIVTCFVVGYLASLVLPTKEKSLAGLTVYTQSRRTTETDAGSSVGGVQPDTA